MKRLLFSVLLLFAFVGFYESLAQVTRVRGYVLEKGTKAPIPFANVIFVGTSIGTITDLDGSFEIQTVQQVDSVQASFIGYHTQRRAVVKGKLQDITFYLETEAENLGEVVVVGDKKKEKDDPAIRMIKLIWENRDNNSLAKLGAMEYRNYEKIQFDLNNINEDFKNRKVFKPIDFIFDYADTSEVNGKVFLPVFITEALYHEYYRRDPKMEKKTLLANRNAGFDQNAGINEYWGRLYQDYDLYTNYIRLFDKEFLSPVSQFGVVGYRYYITDSTEVDGSWWYNIQFIPRRKQELTFKGELWVDTTTWAVVKYDMVMSGDANINFANDMRLAREHVRSNGLWLISKDYILVDFAINDNKDVKGLYGTKTSFRTDYIINTPRPEEFYKVEDITRGEMMEQSKDDSLWEAARPVALTDQEKGIYQMMDTLRTVRAFNTYLDVIALVLSGYWETGVVDIGPLSSSFAFNPIEGLRLRVGGRTYFNRNDTWRIYGHIAYGTADRLLKYNLGIKWLFPTVRRVEAGVFYKYDIEQLGQKYTTTATSTDNFLASFLRRYPFDKLSLVSEARIYVKPNIAKLMTMKFELNHRQIYDAGALNFEFYPAPDDFSDTLRHITTTDVSIEWVYQPGIIYLNQGVDLIDAPGPRATFIFNYTLGLKDVINADYGYHKFYLGYSESIFTPPFGRLKLTTQAGKTFGTVPYPLLDIIPGNATYANARYGFNNMDFFEFVSDQYVSMYAEQHFNGFFFNRVPVLRKLKWREVIGVKGVIGTISDANQAISAEPLTAPSRGYYEASIGIENIFKFFRIDAVWRLSYLDMPNATPFGIRVDFDVLF
jgi:hypothetical protein